MLTIQLEEATFQAASQLADRHGGSVTDLVSEAPMELVTSDRQAGTD
jgi:hypothetical protein